MTRSRASRVLSVVVLFPMVLFAQVGGDRPVVVQAPLNPEFVKYQKAAAPARAASRTTTSGHGLGWIPSPHAVPASRSQGGYQAAAPPPASYDLRTEGRVSGVRDQGYCGSCWAFATFGSLESALLPGQTYDFSENNLKNLAGFDPGPCDGGHGYMSMAYLARWGGPVSETDDPYQDSDWNNSMPGLPVHKHVQDVTVIPGRASALANDALKNAVMTLGGLTTHMWWDVNAYSGNTSAYYYAAADPNPDVPGSGGHGVTLIGWDDNYSRNNFVTPPPGNGAFLVKNSWGPGWGNMGGYFWISYYDTQYASSDSFAFAGNESTTNYTRVYEYDPLGWVSNLGFGQGGSPTGWFANVFTAESAEPVKAVGFYVDGNNGAYTVKIYTGVAGTPVSGTLAATTSGTIATAGYHTVVLPNPVALIAGQKFSAVVQLTTPNSNYPIPIEYAAPDYSSMATASPGQSYASPDGLDWMDTTEWEATCNVALKAYAEAMGGSCTTGLRAGGQSTIAAQSLPPGGTWSRRMRPNGETWMYDFTIGRGAGTDPDLASLLDAAADRAYLRTAAAGGGTELDTPAVGETTFFHLDWQFGGIGGTTAVTERALLDGAAFCTCETAASPGSVYTSSCAQGWAATAGAHTIRWELDYTRQVNENDETNNAASHLFPPSATIAVGVNTNPTGRTFTVDGAAYNEPQTFVWVPGSSHTIAAITPQAGVAGSRYAWGNWSDAGAASHTVAPTTAATFTAAFGTEYLLTWNVWPADAGTITAAPASGDGYYTASTTVQLTANANAGYTFANFTGDLTGITNPQSLTMSAARSVTANFTAGNPDFSVLSGAQSPATISAGSTARYVVTITPAGGFNQAVTLTCSTGLPALATCSFSPTSVTPHDAPITSNLSIATTAPVVCTAGGVRRPGLHPGLFYALWLPVLGIAAGCAGQQRKRIARSLGLLGLGLAFLLMLPGCGSGKPSCTPRSGTPSGNHVVTVTATAGTLQHTTTITLSVQ